MKKLLTMLSFLVISLFFLSCGIDVFVMLTPPTVDKDFTSNSSLRFFLPDNYFENPINSKLKGFDIYYKFYPVGADYYLSEDFDKEVERDFESLKIKFNDSYSFNIRGFYRINLDLSEFSGKPPFKIDSYWVKNKLSLMFEINFEGLRDPLKSSRSAFIRVKNIKTQDILKEYPIYRSYKPSSEYVDFKEAFMNGRSFLKKPIDLKHIPDRFFSEPNPRYNLVIFVMAVGDIIEDFYSILVNLGSIYSIDLNK